MPTKAEKERLELLQGTLDLLILRTLIFGPQHGQGIARAIQQTSGDELLVEHGALTGLVTNRTGGRLSDAYIVVDSDFRPLGTLEKDQSSQIDLTLNPNLIPTSVTYGAPGGPARPSPAIRGSDWWAQGVTAGLMFRY